MKTILLIYGISWVILLLFYLLSLIQVQHGKRHKSKIEWYYIIIILLLTPVLVLIFPLFLISDHKKEKQNRKLKEEQEKSERIQEAKNRVALENFKKAALVDNEALINDCIILAQKIKEIVGSKKYDQVFDLLDCITLPKGTSFGIKKADWNNHISEPFVSLVSGEEDNDIFKYFSVKESPMGAWQACLLYKLWHNLPLFDHSCYKHRTYINQPLDILEIHSIQKNDDDYIHQILCNQEPLHTFISQNGNKYYIERHYWNDWEGLVRELVEVSFENNKVSIFDVESTIVVQYDCGIRF